MPRTLVLNVVGLTPALLEHAPRLRELAGQGRVAPVTPPLPAVTCTSQATFLTGKMPAQHGIVGNGWYDREAAEVKFWKQANGLVQAPRLWDLLPGKTSANLFWWHAMYCGATTTVTPRPQYPADGRKLPDVWTNPPTLRHDLQRTLGTFPLFNFWGPAAGIACSRWITSAAIEIDRQQQHDVTFVYLPHLDYALQKLGPGASAIAGEVAAVDAECGRLLDHFDGQVIVLSEYGITAVDTPVHLNRLFADAGLLTVREEDAGDLLDAGASRAFAVADHQVAHVYVRDKSDVGEVARKVAQTPGVARVLDADGKREAGLDHRRAGDLVALAEPGAWFTYYYWLDEARRPDFATTVEIHRKPGYDPVELFLDPALRLPMAKIGRKLIQKKLGFRTLLDVIPTDASLVKGSHGLLPRTPDEGPVLLTNTPDLLGGDALGATDVFDVIRRHVLA